MKNRGEDLDPLGFLGPDPQPSGAGWRKRRLKNAEDVRRYVADLINRVESGMINEARASRLGNLANILCGMIRTGELETRLAALEEVAKQEGNR